MSKNIHPTAECLKKPTISLSTYKNRSNMDIKGTPAVFLLGLLHAPCFRYVETDFGPLLITPDEPPPLGFGVNFTESDLKPTFEWKLDQARPLYLHDSVVVNIHNRACHSKQVSELFKTQLGKPIGEGQREFMFAIFRYAIKYAFDDQPYAFKLTLTLPEVKASQ